MGPVDKVVLHGRELAGARSALWPRRLIGAIRAKVVRIHAARVREDGARKRRRRLWDV